MLDKMKLEYFDMIDDMVEKNDEVGLISFIDQRLDEFIETARVALNESSLIKQQVLKEQIFTYALKYKECSLEEIGADLCTLIGMLKIIIDAEGV